MLGGLRSLLHLLRRDPAAAAAAGNRRPHRSRFQRRFLRRLRRLGFLPRTAASGSHNTATALSSSAVPDPQPVLFSGEENTTSGQQEEHAPPLPQKVPPTPAEALAEPQAALPPTPRFSGMMQTLRVRLFSPAPPCSVEVGDPHSAPPSPEDEDDVLLLPLAEPRFPNATEAAAWDLEDEPLLT